MKPQSSNIFAASSTSLTSGTFTSTVEFPTTVAVSGSIDMTLQIRTGSSWVDVKEYDESGTIVTAALNASTGPSVRLVKCAGEFRLTRGSAAGEATVYFDA